MGRSTRKYPSATGPFNPSRTPRAKILAIRERCAAGDKLGDIASDLGISTQTVRRWRDAPESRVPADDFIPGTNELLPSAAQASGQLSDGGPCVETEDEEVPRPPADAVPGLLYSDWPEDPQEAFAFWHCMPPSSRGTKAQFNARYGTTYSQLRALEQSARWQEMRDRLEHKLRDQQMRLLRARRHEVLEAIHRGAVGGSPKFAELWLRVIDNWIPSSRAELEVEGVDPRVKALYDELHGRLALRGNGE